MPSTTLRTVKNLPTSPAVLSEAVVVLVDYQNTYTRGVLELEGWQPALDHAQLLLKRSRSLGAPVIHVIHDGGEGSPFDLAQEIGQVHHSVAPLPTEEVVVKTAPNSFIGTNLETLLDQSGRTSVVLAGFMTHMCVTYTAEGAFLRHFQPTVVARACATRSLPSITGPVPADELHRSALAGISDLHGVVVETVDELR